MAQFMSGDNIGGKSPGLQNAAATAANMANVSTGAIAGVLATAPNGSQTTTLAEFNSLANLIATCVDTPATCAQLFSLATAPGGSAPTDTLQAALSVSHNPWNNVAGLFTLSKMSSKFAPVLASAPDAWTIVLQYYGNYDFAGFRRQMDGPGNMAVDAQGNIYVSINYDGQPLACGGKIAVKLTPTGAEPSNSPFIGGGLNGAGWGATIDPTGNLWIGNFGFAGNMCATPPPANSVSKFTLNGVPLSPAGTGFTGNGFIHAPQGTVSDAAGTIWIANFTATANYVTALVHGDPHNVKTYVNNPNFKNAFGIALDAQSNVWVTSGPKYVTKIDPNTGNYQMYTAPGMDRPLGLAIDSQGNVWVANPAGDFDSPSGGPGAVVAFAPNGTPLPGSPFMGGSIIGPWGIGIDGNDNVWVSDWIGQRMTLLCGVRTNKCPPGFAAGQQISPPNGYTSNAMERLTGVVIDQAGNVWVPNNWKTIPIQTNPGAFGMLQIVGAAAPVKAPVWGPPQQP
jgi:sugar lactone lactonase YvrE